MKEKQKFGGRIRHLRTRLSITQDALAEQAQISAQYLSNIERGLENPTFDTLMRLAKSLKVEPWEMFLFEQEGIDAPGLRAKIDRLLKEVSDDEQLRLVIRLLQASLH